MNPFATWLLIYAEWLRAVAIALQPAPRADVVDLAEWKARRCA